MTSIGIRELNQHTSRYISLAKAGESIEVTEHGRPIAKLVPIDSGTSKLERMVAGGEVTPPTRDWASLPPLPPPSDDIDVAAELSAMREEERW